MFFESAQLIDSVYGMQSKHDNKHAKKLKEAIAYLGDKYLLAKPVEKNHG
jgi:hypothetical protein